MPLNELRIVLCYPVEPRHVAEIQAAAPDCEIVDAGQSGIAREILHADLFCGHAKVPVPWDEVVKAGRLRWIQSSAAGLDHCLVPEVIASDIVVSSASGLFADQVAEQTLTLLLGLIRRVPDFFRGQQARRFERLPTDDLHGKTVGIVGFGGNGRRLAEVLSTFRVRMLATDLFPIQKPDYVEQLWPASRLDDLLAESDIVILCLPLNDDTFHLIDAGKFARMKPGSYFVNVARGQVVREVDLVQALASGHLVAAGLDVTEVEPLPATSPLWDFPQVLITPHIGAQAWDRVDVTTTFFCENLARYRAGEPLWNQVDKRLGFPRPEDHAGLKPKSPTVG
jgi:phosphoglycerate dehydrogenase-like enzyme